MRVRKEIIRPGSYFYRDKSGAERLLTATPENIKYWHDEGNSMRAGRIPIPAPVEHDPTAHPLTPAEKLLNNAGEVENFEIGDLVEDGKTIKNVLFGNVEVKHPEAIKGINAGTIRWTSPAFDSFTDSTGKPWKGVITHLALTSRPVLHNQQPFNAQLSLTPHTGVPSEGVCLSRAGLVRESQPGIYTPVYPVAFSLWTGAQLAFPPKEEGGDDKPKKKPEEGEEGGKKGDEGGEEGGKKPPFGEKGGDGEVAAKNKFDPMTGEPIKESLVDPDGDINVWCVLAYMASMALGVEIGEDEINDENGPERLLQLLQEAVKAKIAKADAGPSMGGMPPEPPPTTPPPAGNPKPKNPIIQEQQPMYMSLTREQAEALPANEKGIALSFITTRERAEASERKSKALEAKLFADAKAARQKRINAVMKVMPDDVRTQLQTLADGAQFSLSDDGVVNDPLEPWLKLYERQQTLLPTLLRDHGAELSVAAQPEETTGAASIEHLKKVREEAHRSAGFLS